PSNLTAFLIKQMDLVRILEDDVLDDGVDNFDYFNRIKDIVNRYAPKNTYGVHWMRDIGDIREDVLGMVDFATKGTWLRAALNKPWAAAEDASVRNVCETAFEIMGERDAKPWCDAFLVRAKA